MPFRSRGRVVVRDLIVAFGERAIVRRPSVGVSGACFGVQEWN